MIPSSPRPRAHTRAHRASARWLFLALALLLCGPARAHYPHDIAAWVGVSPGPDPTWIVTSLWRNEAWMVARTTDRRTVDVRYIMGGSEYEIHAAEMLDTTRLVVGGTGFGLWVSDDVGDTWSVHPDIPADAVIQQVDASPTIYEDGIAIAVGEGAIWRTSDAGETWTEVASYADSMLVDVALSPDFAHDGTACAAAETGPVLCSHDFGLQWEYAGDLGALIWQLAVCPDGSVHVGTGGTGLFHLEQGAVEWRKDETLGSGNITTVHCFSDGDLVATYPEEALWTSEDGGASWTRITAYLEEAVTTHNQPLDGNHYFEFHEDTDGRRYFASFEGLLWSDDGGGTWWPFETARIESVKGTVFSRRDDPLDPYLLMATYGGGVVLGDSYGTRFEPLSRGLSIRFFRSLAASPRWERAAVAHPVSSGMLFATADGGESWSQIDEELVYPKRAAHSPDYPEDPTLLVADGGDQDASFVVSHDHGFTWTFASMNATCEGEARAVAFSPEWSRDRTAFGACGDDGGLYASQDGAASFRWVAETGSLVVDLAAAPQGDPLFAATGEGLFRWTPDAGVQQVALEGEPVWGVAVSSDWGTHPYVYAISPRGRWVRSTDGGDTFHDLAVPDGDLPLDVAVAPDFSQNLTLAVGSYSGAWVSRDAGETWENVHIAEVHEANHPTWREYDQWSELFDPDASGLELAEASEPGARRTLAFQGVELDLYCPTWNGGGTFTVTVDGEDATPVSLHATGEAEGSYRRVWTSPELESGWHELEMTVEEGTVRLDAAVVWLQPRPPEAAADTGDHPGSEAQAASGCCREEADTAAAAYGLFLLPLVLRRRRTGLPRRSRGSPGQRARGSACP